MGYNCSGKINGQFDDLLRIASIYAMDECNDAIYPCHLFKALLHKDIGLIAYFERDLDKDYYYLLDWADCEIRMTPKAVRPKSDLELTETSSAVFEQAEEYRRKLNKEEVDYVLVLGALVTPGVGFTFNQLKTLPLTVDEILGEDSSKQGNKLSSSSSFSTVVTGKNIANYCINKNELLKSQPVTVVGFEKEIATAFEVLGRKTKSNLLIVGESGVGKTALVNGFVLRLLSGMVPEFLKSAVVFELDLAALTSGAVNKIEFEDRFKKTLDELKTVDNSILLIENVDKLADKQSLLCGVGDLLKQELNKGQMLFVATTTVDSYTKHLETDKEFVRKFEKITLEEPNADACYRIVRESVGSFEQYHDITIPDDSIKEAIRLSKRYLTEKSLPDSVFDLIDRTMALIRTMNDVSASDVASLSEKLAEIKGKSEQQTESQLAMELYWLHYEMMNKISILLVAQLDDDVDFGKIGSNDEKLAYLEHVLEKLKMLSSEKRNAVTDADLAAVVAKQTGIPMGKMQAKERDKLINAEAIIKRRVVGQDQAIKTILDSIFESRSGLNKKGQPMGSFFFLGPTGTGKTELSKALAEFLFQDESALIRFDMSEFKEEHSVALLYGAPPGYVGYEEGGLLVNKIRQKPYSVVLFDEIEKAHKSVFDLFLQILDEGKLHDRLGRVGDFSNALILFTSNIGSKYVSESFAKGIVPKNSDLLTIMQDYFRPEFLGRLTEIVPFAPISEETVTSIFNIHLKGLLQLLDEQHIKLEMDDTTRRNIAMSGFNPQFGARPVLGIIRKELRRPLSKLIVSGKLKPQDEVCVTLIDNELRFMVNGNLVDKIS